jgi:ribosomal protein S18 acetylase RimI-like enzyme
MQIRPTTTQDLVHLAALETAPDTSAWLGETGLAWHERALADPDQEHLVAETAGTLAAFVLLAGLRDGQGAIEVRRMAVLLEFRRTGHGRALLRAALAHAYDLHGARRVWLDVKTQNLRARALYESEGFILTQTLANAVTEADGTASDLLVMDHTRLLAWKEGRMRWPTKTAADVSATPGSFHRALSDPLPRAGRTLADRHHDL